MTMATPITTYVDKCINSILNDRLDDDPHDTFRSPAVDRAIADGESMDTIRDIITDAIDDATWTP